MVCEKVGTNEVQRTSSPMDGVENDFLVEVAPEMEP